ncbi:serine/threonine protein kinase psk1 [Actinomortierella ambigua]|uniref:Serine/threonine protein kinase psk1 n=1 Tax=Actinomortierella ambigua TaxID=1343610 RepID=A0A9P6QN96_9FUNG|nr:serine/threonine protein kinase psk1 [Actinomortierella ambigua]
MDLFSFDSDDHPNLHKKSVDLLVDEQQQLFAQLSINRKNNGPRSASPCPILAPKPVAAPSSLLSNNTLTPHLATFYHEADRQRAYTPETAFLAAHPGGGAAGGIEDLVAEPSTDDPESADSSDHEVEYEVNIDEEFVFAQPAGAGAAGAAKTGGTSPQLSRTPSPSNGPRKPRRKMSPDDFDLLKVIGRGAYGKVYLVRHRATQALYAMKVLKKASIVVHSKDTESTMSERKILEAIRHPFIVKLHFAFQTDHRLYLILEYASGGELFTHLATERMFSEENTAFYAAQLVLALEHLHSLGIIYRDLKPENIMLDAEGNAVLTDFGLSKVPLESSDGRTNTVCGTIEYMAPEVVCGKVHYDRTVDWWSLGVVIHDMLTGSPPFVASNRKKTMDAILNKKLNLPYYLSQDAKDLLGKLLRRAPSARLGTGPNGVDNIKNHRFFRKIDWKKLAARQLEPPIVPFLSEPESVENFDSKFTMLPVVESPIETRFPVDVHYYGANGYLHTPETSAASSASGPRYLPTDGTNNEVPGGIPMTKTRSSSPTHHHFEDFSYIAKSHLATHGYLLGHDHSLPSI